MNNPSLIQYSNTGDILQDMRGIIEIARDSAYQAVNLALVRRNWLLGRRIAEEELNGEKRADYGLEIIKRFRRFSKQCLENLFHSFPGVII